MLERLIGRDVGHHDGEFLPPITCRNVTTAGLGFQDLRYLPQHLVTYFMAILVVEAFEMVNIDHQQRQAVVTTLGLQSRRAQQFTLGRLLKDPPVVQPGQNIADGLLSQRLSQLQIADGQTHLFQRKTTGAFDFQGRVLVALSVGIQHQNTQQLPVGDQRQTLHIAAGSQVFRVQMRTRRGPGFKRLP